ncbi:MAG: hypothetical protein ACJA08_000671 [Cyclobacteriaceae bacterium]|jgi:hypothetical protein
MDIDPNDYYYYNIYEQQTERKSKVKGFLSMLVLMAAGTIFFLVMFMIVGYLK